MPALPMHWPADFRVATAAACQASNKIYQEVSGTNWNKKGELWFYQSCGTGGG